MPQDKEPARFFPVGLDLRERVCVVVGGGRIGTRKAFALMEAGAEVTVVAPEIGPELAETVGEGRVRWEKARAGEAHLDGAFLVAAASDDKALNREICRQAETRGILALNASDAGATRLAFGARHRTKGLTVAVFSDGRDPAGAKALRDRIAGMLDDEGNQ